MQSQAISRLSLQTPEEKIVTPHHSRSTTVHDRFSRALALLWRILEEWIVDHYVTQYNQQLDEWMKAHTRQ